MPPQFQKAQEKAQAKPKKTADSMAKTLALKGKNTRGTKGEQMRIDPEAHGLVPPKSKKRSVR